MASVNGNDYGFFWNSLNGDRKYNADSFELWTKKFFISGVFADELVVTSSGGMDISVASGYVNADGKVKFFPSAMPFTISIADATNPRIDTVVVERNDGDRNIVVKVIEGEPSKTPEHHTPVRDGGIYQLILAEVYVGKAVSEIKQANITDTRPDPELCGYVTGTVEETDFSQFTAQWDSYIEEFKANREDGYDEWVDERQADFLDWEKGQKDWMSDEQADFLAWYEHMKDQLDHDAAAHIQNEIEEIQADISDLNDGFMGATTTFNSDGSITTTYADERVLNVTFNEDGSITEELSKDGEVYKTKTTTFNEDGSITEEVK